MEASVSLPVYARDISVLSRTDKTRMDRMVHTCFLSEAFAMRILDRYKSSAYDEYIAHMVFLDPEHPEKGITTENTTVNNEYHTVLMPIRERQMTKEIIVKKEMIRWFRERLDELRSEITVHENTITDSTAMSETFRSELEKSLQILRERETQLEKTIEKQTSELEKYENNKYIFFEKENSFLSDKNTILQYEKDRIENLRIQTKDREIILREILNNNNNFNTVNNNISHTDTMSYYDIVSRLIFKDEMGSAPVRTGEDREIAGGHSDVTTVHVTQQSITEADRNKGISNFPVEEVHRAESDGSVSSGNRSDTSQGASHDGSSRGEGISSSDSVYVAGGAGSELGATPAIDRMSVIEETVEGLSIENAITLLEEREKELLYQEEVLERILSGDVYSDAKDTNHIPGLPESSELIFNTSDGMGDAQVSLGFSSSERKEYESGSQIHRITDADRTTVVEQGRAQDRESDRDQGQTVVRADRYDHEEMIIRAANNILFSLGMAPAPVSLTDPSFPPVARNEITNHLHMMIHTERNDLRSYINLLRHNHSAGTPNVMPVSLNSALPVIDNNTFVYPVTNLINHINEYSTNQNSAESDQKIEQLSQTVEQIHEYLEDEREHAEEEAEALEKLIETVEQQQNIIEEMTVSDERKAIEEEERRIDKTRADKVGDIFNYDDRLEMMRQGRR